MMTFFSSLRVERIETGKSVEIVLLGSATIILELAFITKKVFEARKSAWESEKAKWEAKKIELEVNMRLSLSKSSQVQAESGINELLDSVESADSIKKFELALDKFLLIEHTKTKITSTRHKRLRS